MTVAPASPGFSTTIEALRLREWQLGRGRPSLVTDQFSADDVHLIADDRADVHVVVAVVERVLATSRRV
ncbi:hypothetical protein ACFXMQ_20150 [Streptomyces anulatus]|uniref:hypothetical protein n=1 Tax=Streptomyces anulatus TaxID=1892 RepID=UPI0036BE9741